jgi:probable phosphoglycerate mutase
MAKSPSTRLLIIRAGDTEWDQEGRVQGGSDLPLCEEGRERVRAEVQKLENGCLSFILTGPDEASMETASMVAEQTGAKVRRLDELCECNLGLWEGLLGSDMEERFPRACRQWLDDPASVNAPDGEALYSARERVVSALGQALRKIRAGSPVGVVLRPIALGIVRTWLKETPSGRFWAEVRSAPWCEWFDVPRQRLREPVQTAAAG